MVNSVKYYLNFLIYFFIISLFILFRMSTEYISLEQISSLLDEKLNPILEELEILKKDNNLILDNINYIGIYNKKSFDISKSLLTDGKKLIKINSELEENINYVKNELTSLENTIPSNFTTKPIDEFWDSLSSKNKSYLPFTKKSICKRKIGINFLLNQGATDEDGNSIPDSYFYEEYKNLKFLLNILKLY